MGRLQPEPISINGNQQVNNITDYPRINLLGVDMHALNMQQLLNICHESIAERDMLVLGMINVAKIVNRRKNLLLRRSLKQADIVLADGLPIVWLSKLTGKPLPHRLAGIDIMYALLQEANEKHYRVYFLGTKPNILEKAIATVRQNYPGVFVAGCRDGYFNGDEEKEVALKIKDSLADILFVGMPSPKKENFLCKWRDLMNMPVCHGVGGSFDVLAGVTKRAPVWMQKSGLEWFYRLMQEPRKMWKRYLITNIVFIKLSFVEITKTWFTRFGKKPPRMSDSMSGTK
jgi:N-acetylglucosaminyldiphosphoundecaprenol N-acetyl-beta-D-mannosaminyltransferase